MRAIYLSSALKLSISLLSLLIFVSPATSQTFAYSGIRAGQMKSQVVSELAPLGFGPLTCDKADEEIVKCASKQSPNEHIRKLEVRFKNDVLVQLSFSFDLSYWDTVYQQTVSENGNPNEPLHRMDESSKSLIVNWTAGRRPLIEMLSLTRENGVGFFSMVSLAFML